MTRRLLLAALLLALLTPGCGTIFGLAGDHEVRVVTNPVGAQLLVDGVPSEGPSPAVVLLDPAEEHRVDARLDDLHGGTHIKRSARTGIVLLNIIFTLGFGISIDWATGALYEFPEAVVVNLGRAHAPEPPLAAQYPPPPALMPHGDPMAPPPVKSVQTRNLLETTPCEVCGHQNAPGATCASCGQPGE